MPPGPSAPAPGQGRIETLDVVRGVALLGILIMNMPDFVTSYFAEADGSRLWPGTADRIAEVGRDMLFSGKFNSMFSLLFGIGFTIQYARMVERHPAQADAMYARRLGVLLALGLVHGMVFWTGDVLHVYATLGLLLLVVLRRASDRVVWTLIALTLLYPAVSGALRLVLVTPEVTARLVAEAQAWEASNNLAYGQGSFLDAAREHAREFVHFYATPWSLWDNLGFWVQMATTMLLGLLIGRHRLVQRLPELMPRVPRLQWTALVIGLVCALTYGLIFELLRAPGPHPLKLVGSVAYALSRLALTAFYVLSLVRLAQLPAWRRWLAPFAAAGRMPLTNYLMQTAIATTLACGWGFGLWGRVGPAAQLALAGAIFFLVQLPWSVWWLRRHAQGPLEALWRRATYGRAA